MAAIIISLVASTILFVIALRGYLRTVTKLEIPLNEKDSATVLILWLLLSMAMFASFVIPAKVIAYEGDIVPRPLSIIPLLGGAVISAVFFKGDWLKFLRRFNAKK